MNGPGIDPAVYETVRRNVLAEIRSRRRTARWAWSTAAAVSVAALFVWFVFRVPLARPPIQVAKEVFDTTAPLKPVAPAISRVKRVHRHRASQSNLEPMVVKMFTNDPNVIIIWLADRKGE